MIFDKKVSSVKSSLLTLKAALLHGNFQEVLDPSYSVQISAEELEPYLHWSEEFYTRNCIACSDHFELIAICWEKGQQTAIHCHNDQECWVKVISGSFEEEIYSIDPDSDTLIKESSEQVTRHEVTSMKDNELLHSLRNTNDGRSISLHLYVKPIDECRVYDEETQQLKRKKLSYHSLEGKLL